MQNELNRWMEGFLPEFAAYLSKQLSRKDAYNGKLWDAMHYSLMAGGKRLRPVFLMLTGLSLHATEEELLPYAAAMEMIHTYSLIHDDLPAMDNDDYRRGRLTNHKVYGEATAILAGDGLLNFAAEIMADQAAAAAPDKMKGAISAMQTILHAAGPSGMIAGQIADIHAEISTVTEDMLIYIDHNKTGQLITASLKAGAQIAGATEEQLVEIERAGFAIGTAFQIQDDILDIEGDAEKLGKPVGSDEQNHKETFATLYGLTEAKRMTQELSAQAISRLEILPGVYGRMLRELTASLVTRDH